MSSSPYGYGYSIPIAVPMPVPVAVTGFHGGHFHGGFNPFIMLGGLNAWPQPVGGFVPAGGFPGAVVTPISLKTAADSSEDPIKRPPKPSTAAGRAKSLEHQVLGDEKLRNQQWALAYMSYRSAVDAANDRGTAHFRLAFTYTAMKHYSSAVREFRRGLFLDPTLPESGVSLETLFGPDSLIVRTSIMHKVADWVREDPNDPDRLFLLGSFLHFEGDPRARQVLQAALKVAGDRTDHILALLNSPARENAVEKPTPHMMVMLESLPKLPTDAVAKPLNQAVLPPLAPASPPIPAPPPPAPAPAPMPAAAPQPAGIERNPPPTILPPLSTKPIPIIIGDPRPTRDL
jgi:hypothetical protein